jgi:hypothetical protein
LVFWDASATVELAAGLTEVEAAAGAAACGAGEPPDGVDGRTAALVAVTTPEAIDSTSAKAMVARPHPLE